MKRNVIFVIAAVVLIIISVSPFLIVGGFLARDVNRSFASENEIRYFVKDHQSDLQRYVRDEIKEEELFDLLGKSLLGEIHRESNGVVVFVCDYQGGAVAPSTEVGFLYSESDIPSFEDIGPLEFREKEEGKYLAEFPRGNTVEANRILPGWFYYRVNWH